MNPVELSLIVWGSDRDLENLKLYVERSGNPLGHPHNVRFLLPIVDQLILTAKEFPEGIEVVKDPGVEVPLDTSGKNFVVVLSWDGVERVFKSSLPADRLIKILPSVRRVLTKGIRLDVP